MINSENTKQFQQMSTTPRTDDSPCQATPSADLRQQIMDSRVPKNEREWWAKRTIEKLETELAASKAECNLAITRVASILWSGAIDKHTCGDVQQWVTDYTAELARLRAEIERWRDSKNRIRAEMESQAQRAEQLKYLWTEFITLMEITEESDSGNAFNPNKISSCRAMDGKRLSEILIEARQIVFVGIKL